MYCATDSLYSAHHSVDWAGVWEGSLGDSPGQIAENCHNMQSHTGFGAL